MSLGGVFSISDHAPMPLLAAPLITAERPLIACLAYKFLLVSLRLNKLKLNLLT